MCPPTCFHQTNCNTVVRPALWIWGQKPCSFDSMSLPSEYKGWITCSRPFFTETEGNYIYVNKFYPQFLREKTMFIGCPKIKTVQANEIFILSLIEIALLLQSDLLFPWDRVLIEINYVVTTTNDDFITKIYHPSCCQKYVLDWTIK